MARPRRPIELTKTLEQVRFPCVIGDGQGTVTWQNRAGRELFGDRVGQLWSSVVAPEDAGLVERLERELAGAPMDYELNVLTADGQRRRAEISTVPIEGGDECHAIFGVAALKAPRPRRPVVQLTPRQSEVLQLLAEGASTDEIAASLHLSSTTVRNHVQHLLAALGAHSRLEAVVIAHREGLLPSDEA